jgi:hypothetical protein
LTANTTTSPDTSSWVDRATRKAVATKKRAVGNPEYGVREGAREVLDDLSWDWDAAQTVLWNRRPDKRGLLVVPRRFVEPEPEPVEDDRPLSVRMREWAAEAGVECPERGRIPMRVQHAYHEAHNPTPGEAQE